MPDLPGRSLVTRFSQDGEMRRSCEKVYCAGPLFTRKEQEEMGEIAAALEGAGYATFLPQRDGLELTKCLDYLVRSGLSNGSAGQMMSRAIFALDMYQVLYECDVLVANLNGRVPDEGTVAEAAMAWSKGRPVVGYKADSRTVFDGHDNPMVTGLFDFDLCKTIDHLVERLGNVVMNARLAEDPKRDRDNEINKYVSMGGELSMALRQRRPLADLVEVIRKVAGSLEPSISVRSA